MAKYFACFAIIILTYTISPCLGWHALTNQLYDCWPLQSPNEYNMIPCNGLRMNWFGARIDSVRSAEEFNVSFRITASDGFYQYIVNRGFYPGNWTQAKNWCESVECPSAEVATEDNCCLHHVNLHSCPRTQLSSRNATICGPWIGPQGSIFTHTPSKVDNMSHQNWTLPLTLFTAGHTSLIAHIRIFKVQIALHTTLEVLPSTASKAKYEYLSISYILINIKVCGDGVCNGTETCETCRSDCGLCMSIIAAIVVPCALLMVSGIAAISWIYYQKRKLFWDESWIINHEEIRPDTGVRNALGSLASMANPGSLQGQNVQVFTETGIYKSKVVAIKKILKNTFGITMDVRREVRQLRELEHNNLCKFVGASIDIPYVYILTEYCPKGSLYDVLQNDDVPLNWSFRISFAADIARGMAYLHSRKLFHGRLKSSNCCIDDRWTIKITVDTKIKNIEMNEYENSDSKRRYERVYLPPELLHYDKLPPPEPTTDIYSYAIILIEIATRQDPTAEDTSQDDGTWRPPLPELDRGSGETFCPNPSKYQELIKYCWDEDMASRPTFETIKKILVEINPSKMSPVDSMMSMMEKYSKDLEILVAERTQELELEKQKTDRLLYSMLPKPVADKLRQGKGVDAQGYESCTIFFSDIIGFTSIASQSTPIQVVALLNKLYTTFDDILDRHDVYKVETIGDAYMVVSGLPQKNAGHACEIANMALDLIAVCDQFVIPHMPQWKFCIRAGTHSGSVVAGVVGLKMPRYCLFGDTVNTASRMESTGEALKIQISGVTRQILDSFGCYIMESRGQINVKGKGMMETWWLKGRRNTDEILKRDSLAQGNSLHKSIPDIQSDPSEEKKLSSRATPPTPVSQSRVYVHDGKEKTNSFANLIDIDN
ncbi:Atrial natriuretic peptide receptor 1 [Trichoplax sp. H2]|nr:Atrial natriuretic peptide receptor 1 [Trichoplax sp. H2]|eukprot:RDD37929.1 Atrial natriuretic peptide receptor 1 [Trichoplax sp. H2]